MNEEKLKARYERARNLRYKKPALMSLGLHNIMEELENIITECDEVRYLTRGDEDTLIAAMDGDEDEVWEFKMAFSDLSGKADTLSQILGSGELYLRDFDDCTVSLLGNRYRVEGYDEVDEDYYALASYDEDAGTRESSKRIMRMTKPEMLSTIGQCMGIVLAFIDLRQQYDYLKATMDILRGENMSILDTIRKIEEAYENDQHGMAASGFDKLLEALPDRVWIE